MNPRCELLKSDFKNRQNRNANGSRSSSGRRPSAPDTASSPLKIPEENSSSSASRPNPTGSRSPSASPGRSGGRVGVSVGGPPPVVDPPPLVGGPPVVGGARDVGRSIVEEPEPTPDPPDVGGGEVRDGGLVVDGGPDTSRVGSETLVDVVGGEVVGGDDTRVVGEPTDTEPPRRSSTEETGALVDPLPLGAPEEPSPEPPPDALPELPGAGDPLEPPGDVSEPLDAAPPPKLNGSAPADDSDGGREVLGPAPNPAGGRSVGDSTRSEMSSSERADRDDAAPLPPTRCDASASSGATVRSGTRRPPIVV